MMIVGVFKIKKDWLTPGERRCPLIWLVQLLACGSSAYLQGLIGGKNDQ